MLSKLLNLFYNKNQKNNDSNRDTIIIQLGINWACNLGKLDIIRQFHETVGVNCTTYAMDIAGCDGHLEVVKYLHETVGATCTTDAMGYANRNGHFEVVKYLQENM